MQKQRFAVPLVGGLDTKHTETTVIPGKLVQADNVVFSDKDTISVRAGLSDLAYSPADAARLWTHEGRLCIDGNKIVGTTPTAFDASNLAARPRLLPQLSPVGISSSAKLTAALGAFDFASNGSLYISAQVDANVTHDGTAIVAPAYGIKLSICDAKGDVLKAQILPPPTGLTGLISWPRVLINSNSIFVLYAADIGGAFSLFCTPVTLAAPYTPGTIVNLGAMGAVNTHFDAVFESAPATPGAMVVGWQQAAANMRFLSLDTTTAAILATDNVAIAAASVVRRLYVCMGLSGGTYRFYGVYKNTNIGATDLSACISGITGNGAALAYGAGTAGATIFTSAATSIRGFAVVDTGAALACYYTALDANSVPAINVISSINYTTLVTGAEVYASAGVALCSRLYRFSSSDTRGIFYQHKAFTDKPYVFVGQLQTVDATAYTRRALTVLAVLHPDNAGPLHDMFGVATGDEVRLTGMYTTSSETATVVMGAGDLFLQNADNVAGISLYLVRLTTGALGHVPLAGCTLLPSGMPALVYNGIHEACFHKAPQIVNLALGAGTHFSAATQYSVVATYLSVEPDGSLVMSSPSAPYNFLTGGAAQNGTFTVVTEGLTRKPDVKICIWRLVGGNYYLDTMVANNGSVRTVAVTTSYTDAAIVSNEGLYTNGGLVSNQPFPAARAGCAWSDRVFFTDSMRIHYTHKKLVNNGYEYSITNQLSVPSSWGKIVGLAGMDDKLVVFGENKIGYIYGDGPNRAGIGEFSQPIEVVQNLGARWGTHKGIISCDEGVWFQSTKGLRLLTRGMQIAKMEEGPEFGSEVDDLNPGVANRPHSSTTVVNVIAATAIPSKNEIRFYMDNGTCLVLNRDWNQWSKFTAHTTTDAVATDKFYHIHSTSVIRYYDEGTSGGDQQPCGDGAARTEFPVTIKTSKLSLGGVQGFQRVSEVGWTVATDDAFTTVSPVSFTLTATTDEGNATAQAYTLSAQGSVEHYFALQPAYQKSSWVQIKMEFDPNTTGSTAVSRFVGRIRFLNLGLWLGLKRGFSKQNRVKY